MDRYSRQFKLTVYAQYVMEGDAELGGGNKVLLKHVVLLFHGLIKRASERVRLVRFR